MTAGRNRRRRQVQRKVCSRARRGRADIGPQALSFDLDVDVAASRLASRHDLLQTIPPDLCSLTEAPGGDEEGRGQPSRGENVASLPAVIYIAVVKRDRDLGPGAVRIPQPHDVAPPAQDIALLREPIRADDKFVRIAGQLSDTVVEQDQRTSGHHRTFCLRTRAATTRGNSRSNVWSSSGLNSSAASPKRNAAHERTLP